MRVEFKKDGWSTQEITYAGSVRFGQMPELAQEEDHIANVTSDAAKDGYAYISLVTREKVRPGVKLATRCAFDELAAPLIVLPRELIEKDGKQYYADYLEVVLWVNGINVWNLWTDETGETKIRNLLRLQQHVEPGVVHDFAVEITEDRFNVTLDGSRVSLYCGDIYDSFHLGITACEGPCRFYDMEITEI